MAETYTWKELVAEALRELGGEASLRDLTTKLKDHPHRPQTATWNATIRRVVRQYKIFEPITTNAGLAGYRLVQIAEPKPRQAKGTEDPHGEQQGMLLSLGKLCGYETFTNSTDSTIRKFQGQPISSFASVRNDADALQALPLTKIRTTDVMWMAEDSEGLYPRYAFEVEHSTKVKSGLLRLLRIPERFQAHLYIIGPSEEEADLFQRYLHESPFREHVRRFHFFRYVDVAAFYQSGVGFEQYRGRWHIQLANSR